MGPTTLSKFDRLFITVSRLVDTLKKWPKMQTQVYISTKCSCIISSPYSNYLSFCHWQGETTICKALVFWSPVAAVRTVLRSRSVLVNLMVSRKLSLNDGPEAAAKVRRYLENK